MVGAGLVAKSGFNISYCDNRIILYRYYWMKISVILDPDNVSAVRCYSRNCWFLPGNMDVLGGI